MVRMAHLVLLDQQESLVHKVRSATQVSMEKKAASEKKAITELMLHIAHALNVVDIVVSAEAVLELVELPVVLLVINMLLVVVVVEVVLVD